LFPPGQGAASTRPADWETIPLAVPEITRLLATHPAKPGHAKH